MNTRIKDLIEKTVLIVAVLVIMLVSLFKCSNKIATQVIAVLVGMLIGRIIENIYSIYKVHFEDRNKIAATNRYSYSDNYKKKITLFDEEHNVKKHIVVWYEDVVASTKVDYCVHDEDSFRFELPPLIQVNYLKLMGAHGGTTKQNRSMIRLDDYAITERSKNQVVDLYTSRTMLYNDFVTNRAIDYNLENGITVRDVYENGEHLSKLNESKLSNHIGINCFIFEDDKLIVAKRDKDASVSKNKITASFSGGLSENKLSKVNGKYHMTDDDISYLIVLRFISENYQVDESILEELYREKKLIIKLLGFVRLVDIGGQPNFYYVASIPSGYLKTDTKKTRDIVDGVKKYFKINNFTLVSNDLYRIRFSDGKESRLSEAEKSFFVHYNLLVNQERIEGVPDWLYKIKGDE